MSLPVMQIIKTTGRCFGENARVYEIHELWIQRMHNTKFGPYCLNTQVIILLFSSNILLLLEISRPIHLP